MNAKRKGNAFERRICKELSLWWTKGENDNVFWRTSNSGGRATVRRKSKKKAAIGSGDIEAIDPVGKDLIDIFTFELKCGYNNDSFADLLDAPDTAKTQQYAQWFQKVEREHKESKSYAWALIVQRTRRIPLIFMPSRLSYLFDDIFPIVYLYGDDDDNGIIGTHLSNFYRIPLNRIRLLKGKNGTDNRNKK